MTELSALTRAAARDVAGALDRYHLVLADLHRQATNAARRNKPTMWAYYLGMAHSLRILYAGIAFTDATYAQTAREINDRAVALCPKAAPPDAARLWALGVYARRIYHVGRPPSLDWLRARAEEAWL